ncbi:energy-coupling factor ABC transporter ATP-binding protein [Chromatium okenii]|uniref:energy-coupling factor ABC transporter ATP-binding protein n=1 Tax=Chromatium okenii TaxID=61644 RepID=UPI0026EFB321|nr:ABC transporter ATP-binding protein [Chromatium okenii]MBV5308255.1 ABC transporter ATP-binding protein [Chromatium okenii]
MPSLLELREVHSGYPTHPVLRGVNFALAAGERVALIGANGAGKTTLLHLLVGLVRPTAGEVRAFGQVRRSETDFHAVRAQVGLVFQDADDQLFCPTVLEDVAFGPRNLGRTAAQAKADALDTLTALGLAGFAERVTYRLSAGEKRLVALATVLAMKPTVLLLDEPTNGLDAATEARLIQYLAALKQAMVIVSHDQQVLAQLATRSVRLDSGVLHHEPRMNSVKHP